MTRAQRGRRGRLPRIPGIHDPAAATCNCRRAVSELRAAVANQRTISDKRRQGYEWREIENAAWYRLRSLAESSALAEQLRLPTPNEVRRPGRLGETRRCCIV
jgi:hypothetical protein